MRENHKSRIEQVRIKVENNCEIQKERQERKLLYVLDRTEIMRKRKV